MEKRTLRQAVKRGNGIPSNKIVDGATILRELWWHTRTTQGLRSILRIVGFIQATNIQQLAIRYKRIKVHPLVLTITGLMAQDNPSFDHETSEARA
jgi:hypothetical protein